MKGMLKRALGVAAAAAMAVAGMGVLAGTANAAGTATITLTGATVANTTYSAYQIGTYDTTAAVPDSEDSANLKSIGIKTLETWKGKAEAALGADVTDTPEYKAYGDPLAYVAGTTAYGTGDGSLLSTFVDYLEDNMPEGAAPAGSSYPVTEDGESVEFTGLAEGLYMVVSTIDGTTPAQSAGKAVAIIGTQVTVGGQQPYTKLDGKALGVAVVKPSTPQKPSKEGEILDPTPGVDKVYPGKQIEYTIHGTVPEYATKFAFIDTPGLGLTVNVDTNNIKVYTAYNEQTGTGTSVDGDFELSVSTDAGKKFAAPTDETKTISGDSDGTYQFKVALKNDKLSAYQGETIWVVYTAVVNNDAEDTVNNSVKYDDPSSKEDVTDSKNVGKDNTISFQKVGVDGDDQGLNGVEFTLTADSTDNNVGLPEGYIPTAKSTLVNGVNGVVTFSDLPNGTYTITETGYVDGYMHTPLSFKVTLKDGTITLDQADQFGLVQQNEDGSITVKNVKSITQLPLTGAAGTMLFTVLGLLIAGAGVTVYMKSRGMRHMLHA